MEFIPNNVDFQTPQDVCEYMASLLDEDAFFVLEPTPGAGHLVRALRKQPQVLEVYAPVGDYWEYKKVMDLAYDAVVMNPPFSPMKECIRFMEEAMSVAKEVVVLLPWSYILNSENRLNKLIHYGLLSITYLPRDTFPGARVQCAIFHLRRGVMTKAPEFRKLNRKK